MKEQAISAVDINRLYKQVEGKLESIVEKLLVTKINDKDNILQSVQMMMERIFISTAMRISDNNISQASRLLGINRNTLSKKLKEMNETSSPHIGR
ncbi:MAG: helix-turn-helix domain-containing protein [Syntrophorhabdales bacterium]|jgi:DNA-binding protein Fis